MPTYFHLSFMGFVTEARSPCKPPPAAPETLQTDITFQEMTLF